MSDPMQEIKASFFVECEELLEALQDALQSMSDGDGDPETINVAFRAVHSIKGGAGAFGLDELVSFAHHFETAMDEVRGGRLAADAETVALFFQCADMLSDLVRISRDEGSFTEADTGRLLSALMELTGEDPAADQGDGEEDHDFQPMGIALDLPDLDDFGDFGTPEDEDSPEGAPETDASRDVHIRFSPTAGLYTSGNEPLFLLRALAGLGDMAVHASPTAIPDLAEYDPHMCVLSWSIDLRTTADDDTIREVFEFVDGLCVLEIEEDEPGGGPPPSPSDVPPVFAEEPAPNDPVEEVPTAAPETPPAAAESRTASAGAAPAKQGATVRVDLERIDRLVNLVGELVINQAMLAQSVGASGLSGNTKIASGLDEFQQLTRDIQDSVMMIRAQPVKSLFQRMARIVRESSADIGKSVRLRTEGESTEIDKTVIERLADPLTHMIRNAVDHGLESTEDRIANGKSAEGTVTLTASHRSGRVVIEISDDGGGINREKVKSIAAEKGLIPRDIDLSESEIDNLLFLPGFSTASEISNLSGRGVGMDVVKSAISALGGRISTVSTRGKGTTFSISLPLTLAVLDGMVVRVREETLVVPLNAISETLSLNEGDARALGPHTQVVRVRDSFVPLIDLGTELGYSGPRESYSGAIVLLISHEDGNRAALVVDGIEDQRQVVIKGLQDSYGRVPGVAAATILGDGQIALILDPADLLANATGYSRPELVRTGTG